MKPVSRLATLATLVSVAAAATSCNIYSPVAGPSGDLQLLSAARACLDRGDLSCARDNYQKLQSGNASYKDTADSEQAYAYLDAHNAGMAGFAAFAGEITKSGDAGAAITAYANYLISQGVAGQAARADLETAYKLGLGMSGANPNLQAFVKFTSSLALVAEIMAEAAGSDSALHLNDLAANGTSCRASASGACLVAPYGGCGAPGNNFANGTGSVNYMSNNATVMGGPTPDTNQLVAAVQAASDSLSALNPGSDFAKTSSVLSQILNATAGHPECVRQAILQTNIGK